MQPGAHTVEQQQVQVTVPTVQMTVRQQGGQELQELFETPVVSSFVQTMLERVYGPGVLRLESSNAVLAPTRALQTAERYIYTVSAAGAGAGAAAGCVDAELGKWAHELRHMQETGPCLSQPACQPNLPPQLRGSLYIRRSYRKLYELLWRESKCGKAGQQPGFVVTGTPGIGKSAFALYMIQQLGREGQIVFYQYQDDNEQTVRLKLDFRDPKGVVAKRTLPLPDGDLQSPLAWLIIEGPPPKLEFSGNTKTVALSSPNHVNLHTWLKGRYARDRPLYMPTWSLQEMQACREQLYSDVTPDTAAQRYSWLGGSIRHVLVKTGASPEQLVLPAVQKQSAEDLVFAVSQASTWESDFSHTMGHFKVRSDFSVRYVTFASPRISDEVLKQLSAEQKEKLQRFLVASQDFPDLGGLRGVLFERHGHKLFQSGGTVCKWRQLQSSRKRTAAGPSAGDIHEEEEEEQQQQQQQQQQHDEDGEEEEVSHHYAVAELQNKPEHVQQHQPFDAQEHSEQLTLGSKEYTLPLGLQQMWDDGKQQLVHLDCSSKKYIMPLKSNNAAWDAVVLGGQVPLILQFTVNRLHGIKARPVDVLLQRLSPNVRDAAVFVFVVPPNVFDRFPYQPWQTVKDSDMMNVPSALQKLEQWVMELPVQQQ